MTKEIADKIWERFIFLMAIDSFGEKEVIAEKKVQKMFFGSVEKHKQVFDQAVKDVLESSVPIDKKNAT